MRKLIKLAKLPVPLPVHSIHNRRSLLGLKNLFAAIEFLVSRDDIDNKLSSSPILNLHCQR